ncbi:MAG TPA: ABC transporter substrate-binding protein [Burkholderiaceae bacterium]|nr:ABC transporter substrate-binding protein [Burkholderiaceae bacterium]
MTRRRTVLTTLAAALLAGMPIAAQAQGFTDSEILIGFHGPMTGPASWVGLGARDGALLALEEINAAGGIHGRKIKLVPYDDGGKASEAEAVAKKMIQNDKVFAILGGGVSATTIPTAEVAHAEKVPYLNGPGASPKIMDLKSRWVFSGATIDVRDISENSTDFIGGYLKAKTIAVINGTDEFSQSLTDSVLKGVKERYGANVVAHQKFNSGDTDFSSQLIELRKANPDLILVFGLYVEAARVVRQARELGIKTPMKGDTSTMNKGFLTIAGPAAEGFYSTYVPLYFNGDPAKDMVEFEARYKKMYPRYPADRPNYVDVYNYGTMYALAEGLKRMGPKPDRRKLVEALETLDNWKASDTFKGALHIIQPLTFTQSHNGNRRTSDFRIVGGQYRRIDDYKPPQPTTKFPPNATLNW